MKRQVLETVFADNGAERSGDEIVLPKGNVGSVYVAIGSESLIIDRVTRIHLHAEIVGVETARDERYAVTYEDVRAIRFVTK